MLNIKCDILIFSKKLSNTNSAPLLLLSILKVLLGSAVVSLAALEDLDVVHTQVRVSSLGQHGHQHCCSFQDINLKTYFCSQVQSFLLKQMLITSKLSGSY